LEKFILKQIQYLKSTNSLDLTVKQQNGLKDKSTATAGLLLQLVISCAADNEKLHNHGKSGLERRI
jgi:hypothetical protein